MRITGGVTVTVGGVASNSVSFTVTAPPANPTIVSLSPTSGAVGTAVTISGTNFGATQGSSVVRFNGTTATPTSWSAAALSPVPTGAATGGVTVTVGGVASNSVPFTVPTGSGLPAPWTTQDIGSPTVAGSASFVNGTFTVAGAGRDIWDNADQFRFVYQPLSGNGEIVARVGSLGNRDAWSKAAVMIRETLSGDSPHALVAVTPDNGTVFQWRAAPAGVSATLTGLATGAPQWVRVVRNGTALSGYCSANGTTWTLISTTTVTMAAQVYVGLAVTSHNPAVTANATFDNVTVTSGSTPATPTIVSLSPTSGAVGTAVTISGTNFGATQGSSVVRFNGTTATPTSWSAGGIVAPVPPARPPAASR